jgi:hypothetical protein
MNLAISNLGALALDTGDLEEAENFCRRSQRIAQDIGDRLMLGVSVGNLGHAALLRGDRAEALRLYRDTAALCSESGHLYMLIEALLGLTLLAAEHDASAAARWFGAMVGWRRTTGYHLESPSVRALRERAEAQLRRALGPRFDDLLQEGMELDVEIATHEATAWALGVGLAGMS